MGTTTDILGLYKPDNGETGWGDEVDANFDVLESRITVEHYNVQDFGAVNDGATDSHVEIQAAVDAAAAGPGVNGAGVVYFPPGAYWLGDGNTITVTSDICIRGPGPAASVIIYAKDEYAFTGTSVGGVRFEHLDIIHLNTSTSGGGIHIGGTSSQIVLNDVIASGSATPGTRGIWFSGVVGGMIYDCHANGWGISGVQIDASDSYANHIKIHGGRFAGNGGDAVTNPSVAIYGQNNAIVDSIVESNHGVGVLFDGTTHRMQGVWFEDNFNHNVYVTGSQIYLLNNYFASLGYAGSEPGAMHIYLEDVTPSTASCDQIIGNHFINVASPTSLYIGENRNRTGVIGNRNLKADIVDDQGELTWGYGNADPSSGYFPGFHDVIDAPFTLQVPSGATDSDSAFKVTDVAHEDEFSVVNTGHAIFHTKNAPSVSLPTNGFTFYWDEATGKIKADIKRNGGSTLTRDVTPGD